MKISGKRKIMEDSLKNYKELTIKFFLFLYMEKFKSRPKTKEEEADSDLRQLLNYSDVSDTDTIRARSRGDEAMEMLLLNAEGVDDALLDSLVKTATQTSHTRSNPRERKRSRHADRNHFI
ncbi:hypothetical protein Anas_04639 [Armadillidium nasatum]|uniref:Uncharacterized protein n=1 Tax=Armadillidium nasatum TaxID=96803 RepID=A0A5N5SP01_9CRUS|nr:hypothetical protein Anas_04639 [Armadillidium nasatum]